MPPRGASKKKKPAARPARKSGPAKTGSRKASASRKTSGARKAAGRKTTALGASRKAIVRDHLVESFLLVALGGIGGVLIGSWGLDLLLASLAKDWIPRSDEIALSLPVLLVTGATALLTDAIARFVIS